MVSLLSAQIVFNFVKNMQGDIVKSRRARGTREERERNARGTREETRKRRWFGGEKGKFLSSAPRGFDSHSRVLARLASLAQIGELARRLKNMRLKGLN